VAMGQRGGGRGGGGGGQAAKNPVTCKEIYEIVIRLKQISRTKGHTI